MVYFKGKEFETDLEKNQYIYVNKNKLLTEYTKTPAQCIGQGLWIGFFFGWILLVITLNFFIYALTYILPPIIIYFYNKNKREEIIKFINEYQNYLDKKNEEQAKEEKKRAEEREKIELKKKNEIIQFKETKDYNLIKDFVLKFGEKYSSDNVEKLQKIINKKGNMFVMSQIKQMIREERINQDYEIFKKKSLSKKPKTYKDFLRVFIEIYGENYTSQLVFLEDLLKEKNIIYEKSKIYKQLDELKEEMDEEQFEKSLSTKSKTFEFTELKNLTGHEFESFLEQLFTKMGYKSEKTRGSGDQGADLIIEKFGEKTVVQAKNYNGKLNNKCVQEVVASIKHYNADKGMVVTTNYFYKSAEDLAKSNNIDLVDREKLKKWIEKYL